MSGDGKQETDATKEGDAAEAPVKFVPPPRPDGIRENLLPLYGLLAFAVLVFAVIGETMKMPIPDGKFRLKNGTFINIEDFDPVAFGPYPKCHPHHNQHEVVAENGTRTWVNNTDAPKAGPFPVGHPDNPEWMTKIDAETKKDNAENRFKWVGLQPNLHLLALATLCVYIGCKHSVVLFTEPPETREEFQMLQADDATWFPIMGSGVLFGMFLVLKYLGSDYIKLLITCGILIMCLFGLGANLDQLVNLIRSKKTDPLFTVPYVGEKVTAVELIGMVIGLAMAVGFVSTKHWIINNVFGISFCIIGIKLMGTSNFKTGTIMFVGLFFYDVFWVFGSKSVFGSNVMVSVAKGVEAPIKLMFPRFLGGCGQLQHSMLGLGDIVVPGIFIAFMAKFDAKIMGTKAASSFIYLNTTMVAYVLSLVTTVGVMLFFNAAQPALLYIVPYVLITAVVVALVRGEFKELWAYDITDTPVESKSEQSNSKTESKKDS